MNILWLTWKDMQHPAAGGAELVASELCRRLLRDNHRITMLTCGYPGAEQEEVKDGVRIIRVGSSRYSHPVMALSYYLRHLRNQFDCLIEEVNGGAPYFSVLFAGKARKFMLYHQLARINWLYEIKRPLNYVGYYGLVPFATRLASIAQPSVITVSDSTRQSLAKHGFKPHRIHIISEGITLQPVTDLHAIAKYTRPTLLSLGAMRYMKRTIDHIAAFEIAKRSIPRLELKVAGSADTAYGKQVLTCIDRSPFRSSIEYLGKVSDEDKVKLMQRAHLILQTAIEEGWGLTITEAASQGTPAVAYNVAGLRDSIKNGVTGLTTEEHPAALATGIVHVLRDTKLYQTMRRTGWNWSKEITFDQSYKDFLHILQTA